eukprot:m.260690 g.260690  ORF g.260690 m.260690 type:complete len:1525 (-) comp40439_c0_seq1:147-4721(-)
MEQQPTLRAGRRRWSGHAYTFIVCMVCCATYSVSGQGSNGPSPSNPPTRLPTTSPTERPTERPTTESPTISITLPPTTSPTQPPTTAPTGRPSKNPSMSIPTTEPTRSPTGRPTVGQPTQSPTALPTDRPTTSPTGRPTKIPSTSPTAKPTTLPTDRPTRSPSVSPTPLSQCNICVNEGKVWQGGACVQAITLAPIPSPTRVPTICPTTFPTSQPSLSPTHTPSQPPSSTLPTNFPSVSPSKAPTPCAPDVAPAAICVPTTAVCCSDTVQICSRTCCDVSCESTLAPLPSPTTHPTSVPTSLPTSWTFCGWDSESNLCRSGFVTNPGELASGLEAFSGACAGGGEGGAIIESDACTAYTCVSTCPEYIPSVKVLSPVGTHAPECDADGTPLECTTTLADLCAFEHVRDLCTSTCCIWNQRQEHKIMAATPPPLDECGAMYKCSADCYQHSEPGSPPCGWNVEFAQCMVGFVTTEAESNALLETSPGDCDHHTSAPTLSPSTPPTREPTATPTSATPTFSPTSIPTATPSTPYPTTQPSRAPTSAPSFSAVPSTTPTVPPSRIPTTRHPSQMPTKSPLTSDPTTPPSPSPSTTPSSTPTRADLVLCNFLTCVDIEGDPRLFCPAKREWCRTSTQAPTPFSSSPSHTPTAPPTPTPTPSPTLVPTQTPSTLPTASPSSTPSVTPSNPPSTSPSPHPTTAPTTATPTLSPTSRPTLSCPQCETLPSPGDHCVLVSNEVKHLSTNCLVHPCGLWLCVGADAINSTDACAKCITWSPTAAPLSPTSMPSRTLSTNSPTVPPTTSKPTNSASPTRVPTSIPTVSPTPAPSGSPSSMPTLSTPTSSPSAVPSTPPTNLPSTSQPSRHPTTSPTAMPSHTPTTSPTQSPTSARPTVSPTITPSMSPSTSPTQSPTRSPTTSPSKGEHPSTCSDCVAIGYVWQLEQCFQGCFLDKSNCFDTEELCEFQSTISDTQRRCTQANTTCESCLSAIIVEGSSMCGWDWGGAVGTGVSAGCFNAATYFASDPAVVTEAAACASAPTHAPSTSPTRSPTTSSPSKAPTTLVPSHSPSSVPTTATPTTHPSTSPTTSTPTVNPTSSFPTAAPTTHIPSSHPSSSPSTPSPSQQPTQTPVASAPTHAPSNVPSPLPTSIPSLQCGSLYPEEPLPPDVVVPAVPSCPDSTLPCFYSNELCAISDQLDRFDTLCTSQNTCAGCTTARTSAAQKEGACSWSVSNYECVNTATHYGDASDFVRDFDDCGRCSSNCGVESNGGGTCNDNGCTSCNSNRLLVKGKVDGEYFGKCLAVLYCKANQVSLGALKGKPCKCTLNKCHECVGTVSSETCKKCRSSYYLLDGECVPVCPPEYTSSGTREWGRKCLPPFTCKSKRSFGLEKQINCKCMTHDFRAATDCIQCEFEAGSFGQKCVKCTNGKYLNLQTHTCQDNCDGITNVVSYKAGNKGAECRAPFTCVLGKDPAGENCKCSNDVGGITCLLCDWSLQSTTCFLCGNKLYLKNGTCVSDCGDMTPQGEDKTGRECV